MMCALRWLSVLVAVLATLTGCTSAVSGTPTWPGARLEKVVLTAADFPDGVQYDRIIEEEGVPDGAGGPPPMLSDPPGCTEGFSKSIGASAERGPGSAAKYVVGYDGARMLITVLSWSLDLETLEAIAERGEVIVIDPRRVHAVRPSADRPRVTVGLFIGVRTNEPLAVWS